MSSTSFRWGNSHWFLTLVLAVLCVFFVSYYAHTNYASTNGNQFLSVAATLSSIILAVVAIVIAVAQIVMSGQQGSQFEGRMGELRGAIDKISPLPSSVLKLEDIVKEIKETKLALGGLPDIISDRMEKRFSSEMNASQEIQAASTDVGNSVREELIEDILATTVGFSVAVGAVCAAHGKSYNLDDIYGVGFLAITNKAESAVDPKLFNFVIHGVARMLGNFGLCSIPDERREGDLVEVNEALRRATKESIADDIEGDEGMSPKIKALLVNVRDAIST